MASHYLFVFSLQKPISDDNFESIINEAAKQVPQLKYLNRMEIAISTFDEKKQLRVQLPEIWNESVRIFTMSTECGESKWTDLEIALIWDLIRGVLSHNGYQNQGSRKYRID